MSQETQVMDGSLPVVSGPSEPASGVMIAQSEYAFSPEIVLLSEPTSARAEAVRALRTHIMAQHVEGGRRGLAVCAPSAGSGATFTAVNLAVALAQIGAKVLLIDGDLRHAGINQFIRPSQQPRGLLQWLERTDKDYSDVVQTDFIPHLSVMFAGGVSAAAQELLAGERFAHLVERCLRDFDLTIIDTPAANSYADARRISTVAGYSLIVAKRDLTFVNDIKTLAAQLREDRAQVVGTVLNEA